MLKANINIRDNTDWSVPLQFTDRFEVPYNLTGSTFRMDIKASVDDVAAVASLTTANGGIVSTDLANGVITIEIADFAIAPGDYVYDLVRISGTARETLSYGALTVEKGVTGL